MTFELRKPENSQVASMEIGLLISEWLKDNGAISMFRTCGNCANMKNDRTCALFNAQPPVSVVLTGCDQHFDVHEIPYP